MGYSDPLVLGCTTKLLIFTASYSFPDSHSNSAQRCALMCPLLCLLPVSICERVAPVCSQVVDLTLNLEKPAKYADIMKALKNASENEMKGVSALAFLCSLQLSRARKANGWALM